MRSSRLSLTDLVLHLHPPSVPSQTLRFSLSWGLGGMAVMLAGLLLLSGMLLLLVYQPSTEHAYRSILTITTQIPFGLWVRNTHYLSANLLLIIAGLHCIRVILTGAFGPGRQLNWMIGLLLFLLISAANFTGYLLPWDQLSYWAVTICTSMLGYIPLYGDQLQKLFLGGVAIGPSTLSNFFVLHVALIPSVLVTMMFWHFWLVRRAGGLVQAPSQNPSPRIPTVPNLLMREAAVGLVLIACVLLLAIVWNAPLQEQANPGMSPNPAKAPWYFQGFQELLLHLHPTFAIFIWPLVAGISIFCIPLWRNSALPPGQWFGSSRGRTLVIWTIPAATLVTLGLILLDSSLPTSHTPTTTQTWITRGLLPTCTLLIIAIGTYCVLVYRLRFSQAEAIMAGLMFAIVALAVCTVVSVWFRGPEMQLNWPWLTNGIDQI